MKVLQLTHKPPVPSVDGGCLAMSQITTSLINAGVEVKVVSIDTPKHPIVQSEEFEHYCNLTQFESIFVDTKVSLTKVILSLVKCTSLQADRFFSKEMTVKLETLLLHEKYDVVILESIFVGNYIETIRKFSHARIILRVHNVEYLIWKRLSKQTKNPVKKVVYYYLANSLKRFELSLFKKIDGYLPITDVDHIFFKAKFPNLSSKVIPFAINLSQYPYQEHKINENNISLFHIGSMNWQPNIEGMNWFLEKIWEKIVENYVEKLRAASLQLVIAGKGNKAAFGNRKLKNLQIFDFIENAQQFINEHDIMVVPLLSGSGMRIKIMEGLALGKPIITTSIGAEGIEITDKENIFIADTPEEMMQTIDYCINNVQKSEEIGKNARKLIENKYTQEKITQDLITYLKI
jgi:glycosyltransferase involved in cell wall biosynthesis